MKMSNDEFFMAAFVVNKHWEIAEVAKRFNVSPAVVRANVDKFTKTQSRDKS